MAQRSIHKIWRNTMVTPLLLAATIQAHAGITLDGTLGKSGSLTGPNYAITADLGKQMGGNLFHSFSQFNLVKGDIATFSGPSSVANIISRVTGGSASSIDGTIRSTISGANLYFINPAGVMFGPNASLDISGSFHVSTADYLKLGTDGRFDASTPANSILTVSPPSAFGFVSVKPAIISFDGTTLQTDQDKGITVIGGEIKFINTILYAPGGTLSVLSAASSGQADWSGTSITNSNFSNYGLISIKDIRADEERLAGNLDVSSKESGKIYIKGGDINLINGWIFNDVYGSRNGGNTTISAQKGITLSNTSSITSDTLNTGNAGTTSIETGYLNIDNSVVQSLTSSSGKGGNIIIKASDSISITNFGIIAAQAGTSSTGDVGAVLIETGKLTIDGNNSYINGSTYGTGNGGSISIKAFDFISLTNGGAIANGTATSGDAGTTLLETGKLTINGGSRIIGSTYGTGKGGSLSIKASDSISLTNLGAIEVIASPTSTGDAGTALIETGKLTIEGGGYTPSGMTITSHIDSATYGTGKGGSLSIKASDSISLTNGGAITVETSSAGDAGTALIETGKLTIDGLYSFRSGASYSNISGVTRSTGKGGSISIKTSDSISLTNGGAITVETGSTGDAGDALIETEKLSIDRYSSINSSTIGAGKGGSLSIKTYDSIRLTNGGGIAIGASSTGDAGAAMIETGKLTIDGYYTFSSGKTFSGIGGSTYGAGKGGSLSIKASDSISLTNGGAIAVGADSTGDAGNALVETGKLTVDGGNSSITGLTLGAGKGGSLTIKASDSIRLTNGGAITVEAGSTGDAGTALIETVKLTIDGGNSSIAGLTLGAGKGGSLTIKASDSISLTNEGEINVDSRSTGVGGNAGTADIETKTLTVDHSIISGVTLTSGRGGNLYIKASDSINLIQGGIIAVSTIYGTGDAGTATLETKTLNVDAYGQITGATGSSGKGGNISIKASDVINLTNGGGIIVQAEPGSSGDAGTASIETRQLNINGTYSTISGSTFSTGKGGSLSIKATDAINLVNMGGISVSAEDGTGDAGTARVETANLNLDADSYISSGSTGTGKAGDLNIKVRDSIKLTGSSITTATANADGGSITIDPVLIDMRNSQITTSVKGGAGNGGNISVTAKQLVLDTSSIIANAEGGNGGNISLNTQALIPSTTGSIISASSKLGISGTISVSSPLVDIGAGLAVMPNTIADLNALAPKRCASNADEMSSFSVMECSGAITNPDRPVMTQ